MLGGANGARIRLAPQKDWKGNEPVRLKKVRDVPEPIADGYRNWFDSAYEVAAEELMLARTQLMGLIAPEMTATRIDLVFGSNSILRAYSEVYAQDDSQEKFARDFVAAWTRVMNADRFDPA